MRPLVVALVSSLAAATLGGCGGASDYCSAVQDNATVLNAFGQERSNAAYNRYATALEAIAEVAPESVAKDWTALADATKGVVAAQKDIGLDLSEMTDVRETATLTNEQRTQVNDAYRAFNDTTDQRAAVVTNVKKECDITLE